MNKVILTGRLTRDPDIRWTPAENSMAIANYTLAVDRRRPNADGQREADFIRCVAFGRNAEFAEKWFHQGIKISIVGRIQTGKYTNSEGQTVYTTDVVIEDQEFAESKAASERQQTYRQPEQQSYQTAQPQQYMQTNNEGFGEGFESIPDLNEEGLPFV